jgi:hypothetical protein
MTRKNNQAKKLLLIGLFLLFTSQLKASEKEIEADIEAEAGILSSELLNEGFPYYLSGSFICWFHPYAGISAGINFVKAKIDESFASPLETNVKYVIESDIQKVNATLGIKLLTPTFKNLGLMADLKFSFAPVPLGLVSVDKYFTPPTNVDMTKPGYYLVTSHFMEHKTKIVYTHFNPAFILKGGIFFNYKNHKGDKMRIALGLGMSQYNPYNTYYRASIDGMPLKKYLKLKSDQNIYSIFIQVAL